MTARRLAAAAAMLLVLAATPSAHAQQPQKPQAPPPPPRGGTPTGGPFLPGTRVRERDLPLLLSAAEGGEITRFQRLSPPLTPQQTFRLRMATAMRQGGLAARARDTLLVLDREVPHHGSVQLEFARTEVALGREADAVTRLRAYRTFAHDSLAGSRELAGALEHQGRPREAAAVALETWICSPADGEWAREEILRLAPADARGVTEAVRAAATVRPWRSDLVRGHALLLARQGRIDDAIRALAAADAARRSITLRVTFADDALRGENPADSAAAWRALASAAGETSAPGAVRAGLAQRALDLAPAGARGALASDVARTLADVPADQWGSPLLLEVARELRGSGRGPQAEALLAKGSAVLRGAPELELERLLTVLREGPPARALPGLDSLARAWPGARWMQAEALFFAGLVDSAHAVDQRLSEDGSSPDALSALERAYLIEEEPDHATLGALGAIAYARWRGDAPRARVLADSLWTVLPRTSPSYAQAAMQAYGVRAEAGAWREALLPLAAVADSLPGDRLAPLARQRAGEAYQALGDSRGAIAQFEECLARYPRAWNAAEVRRRLEQLRKDHRL